MESLKKCCSCKELKTVSLFNKKQGKCKQCQTEYNKKYNSENRKDISAKSLEWQHNNREKVVKHRQDFYLKNKEKVRANHAEYYEENIEKVLENKKQYYEKHRSDIQAKTRDWAKSNPERVIKYKKKWESNNLPAIRASGAKRRASKFNAAVPWGNKFFIEEIYDLARIRTAAFGIKFEVDHIVPLQSKLVCGLHWEGNFQIISKKENISKGNRWWPDMPEKEKEV